MGLLEGFGIDSKEPVGKVMNELVALVKNMAEQIEALAAECKELRDYIEEVDEDLSFVEDDLYDDEDEDEDEDEDFDFDDEDEDDDDEANFYEAVCPSCGEVVCFDDSLDPEDITCPACGEKFSCLCDGDCDGCDGDCDEK